MDSAIERALVCIEAKLNGRGPYRLILDTGATETVLTPATAKALGLHTAGIGPRQAVGTLDSMQFTPPAGDR